MKTPPRRTSQFIYLLLLSGSLTGCTSFMGPREPFPATPPEPPLSSPVPRELEKVTLPRYVVEPPDILLIEGVKLVVTIAGRRHESALFDLPQAEPSGAQETNVSVAVGGYADLPAVVAAEAVLTLSPAPGNLVEIVLGRG